jgi:hypothetical protein
VHDQACKVFNPGGNRLTIISIAIADIALLFIMLIGLFRLRRYGGGLGLTSILWKQVWWLFSQLVVVSVH